jgi:hypothetical protein
MTFLFLAAIVLIFSASNIWESGATMEELSTQLKEPVCNSSMTMAEFILKVSIIAGCLSAMWMSAGIAREAQNVRRRVPLALTTIIMLIPGAAGSLPDYLCGFALQLIDLPILIGLVICIVITLYRLRVAMGILERL